MRGGRSAELNRAAVRHGKLYRAKHNHADRPPLLPRTSRLKHGEEEA